MTRLMAPCDMREPPAAARETRRLEHGDWQIRVFIVARGDFGLLRGHADLFLTGFYKCRVDLTGQFSDDWIASNVLQAKALDWIDDWQRRERKGESGFSEL